MFLEKQDVFRQTREGRIELASLGTKDRQEFIEWLANRAAVTSPKQSTTSVTTIAISLQRKSPLRKSTSLPPWSNPPPRSSPGLRIANLVSLFPIPLAATQPTTKFAIENGPNTT